MSKLFKELIESYRVHDDLGLPDETRDNEIEKFGKTFGKTTAALRHIQQLSGAFSLAEVSVEELSKAEENLKADLGISHWTETSLLCRVLPPRWRYSEGLSPRNVFTLGFGDTLEHEELQYLMGMGAQVSIMRYSERAINIAGNEISFDMIVTLTF